MTQTPAPLRSFDPRTLGPFRLYGVLGSGVLGPVYLGRGTARRDTRKQVAAVRALRPELLRDRQLKAQLRAELTAAESVDGRLMPGTLGYELDSERPWLATAFVPGLSLAQLVGRYGRLPGPAVRALGAAVAEALLALHAVGVVHRRLHPGSVLLATDHPRLTDQSVGLLLGGTAQAADDIVELGAVLAFAATARHPFRSELSPAGSGEPDLRGVPEALRGILLACLHGTPEARPTAEDVVRELDEEGRAARPARTWLPEAYLLEINAFEEEARQRAPRRLFGG